MISTLTVSQLNFYIKSIIDYDENLRSVTVKGEISNFTLYRKSGHMYFTLKDANAAIKAVMFRADADRLGFMPEDGMSVTVRAKVSVFERDGVYQLYVSDIIPDGLGKQMAAFIQLKDKLEKEGLFAEENKKEIPGFPKKIGVATSTVGAAVQDIISVTGRRYPLAELEIFPCVVQGERCASSVIRAVNYFNIKNDVDLIIVARGGGSYEDLSGFNDEKLARTVASSKIPIISAVGHETDFTIIDFASDMRAPTPSAAAELSVPDITELSAFVENFKADLLDSVNQIFDEKEKEFLYAKSNLDIESFIGNRELLLERTVNELNNIADGIIISKEYRFAEKTASLNALDPLAVLMRGYSAVYKDGNVITSSKQIKSGDEITVIMKDGEIICDAK